MNEILGKAGSYWIGKKANKEIDSVGDDINVRISFSLYLILRIVILISADFVVKLFP